MQALKPIILTLCLGLIACNWVFAQGDNCPLYADILQRGDSLSRVGNYVAAIKTYRAARVACPSKVYETDMRVERIVYRLVQMREQAIQRRDEVLQKIALMEKDLQRARFNEEVAERRERLLRQANEQERTDPALVEKKATALVETQLEQKDPWDLLRTGHYQEALPLLEASAFNDLQDSLSMMRLAHANLFNGRIEVAESIYRVLKPLPYRTGKYKSFAEAYLADFNALENAEGILGNGAVIPVAVREAYLRIRADLENYAQALDLAEQERKKSKELAKELGPEKVEQPDPVVVDNTVKVDNKVEVDNTVKVDNSSAVLLPNEPVQSNSDTTQHDPNGNAALTDVTPAPLNDTNDSVNLEKNTSNLEASTSTKEGSPLRNNATHSRSKLEEDRPLPPTPEFVMKNLINTELDNKTTRTVKKAGEPSSYIVFIGDFDLNDYYAQRTLKKVRDQYGIMEARIRYFSEVLKYRIVLAEFATKEEAAQYTLNYEQKYRERVWMGVLY
jgi:tetratricopeptide (TPR) repeat protein